MSILRKINGHQDLVQLSEAQREALCDEIREFLVEHVSQTGGHLASNLGVVELSVAIETVFDTEKDRLVFDVGHQSYVHKLLTGRQADFHTLRQFGGMAGFPKPCESDTDSFVAGHASSSVSIALGMARARTLQNQDYHVVALLGDGAATGGMVYEGLNDAAVSREPMVVILNDNAMSIDRNVGGVAKHLSRIRAKAGYLGLKQKYRQLLGKVPGGKGIYRVTRKMKDWIKRMLIPVSIFESMGMTYLGPVDGHDVHDLISLLRSARDMKRPVVIHVLTQKGRGYAPAEESPSKFHGVGKFNPVTGETATSNSLSFSQSFGDTLCDLADEDSRVVAITAAMPGGPGLLGFKKRYPNRLFDVGIAEEHAVSMAGGLAKQGMVPVVALYSTFLQRSYDMLMQDVGLLGLHVVFAVDRAGLVGEDGETHHGIFDVGFLRQVPGMRILCPASTAEQQIMFRWAVREWNGPVAIRYPRGGDRSCGNETWTPGCDVLTLQEGTDVTLICYGTLTENVLHAAQLLQASGIRASVLRLACVAPLPTSPILERIIQERPVVIFEEVCSGSGIREALSSEIHQTCPNCRVYGKDLGKAFVTHGDTASLYRHYGLDAESIHHFVVEVVRNENQKET